MKYVYGYRDPLDFSIKYIGQTRDVHKRLNEHYKSSSYNPGLFDWLHTLRKSGYAPIIETLATVEDADARREEYNWIIFGLGQNWPLFNLAVYKPTGKYKKKVPGSFNSLRELNKILRSKGL
jgi:hypothetical protein